MVEQSMLVSETAYEELALREHEQDWELDCGRLRGKPPMTAYHNQIAWLVGFRLQQQLRLEEFEIRVDAGRTRRSPTHYYIPDVMVVPAESVRRLMAEQPNALEAYIEALPLIVEVWSPSTGAYDVDTKFPEYQRRGDLEIWRIHPHERTLIAWRRQPDGTYTETLYTSGTVQPAFLPGVSIDLASLFQV